MARLRLVGCLLFLGAGTSIAMARPEYLSATHRFLSIKSRGAVDRASCSLCHVSSGPPGRNPFGKSIEAALDAAHTQTLTERVLQSAMSKDADGDGFSSNAEVRADTLPGDPKSHPAGKGDTKRHIDESPKTSSGALAALSHPILAHFPIALFLTSIGLEIGARRGRAAWQTAAEVNLRLAAVATLPTLIAGVVAWQTRYGGAPLQGVLLWHLLTAAAASVAIWALVLLRGRKSSPGYYLVAALGVGLIAAAGHLGGMLSGVAS